jgi:hypothetical protein
LFLPWLIHTRCIKGTLLLPSLHWLILILGVDDKYKRKSTKNIGQNALYKNLNLKVWVLLQKFQSYGEEIQSWCWQTSTINQSNKGFSKKIAIFFMFKIHIYHATTNMSHVDVVNYRKKKPRWENFSKCGKKCGGHNLNVAEANIFKWTYHPPPFYS